MTKNKHMNKFNDNFKTELYQTIEDIEDNSLVEVVAMVKAQSGSYRDISFGAGAVILFLAYTYFMFAPTIFDVYLIYFMTIIAFIIGYAIVEFITPVKRVLTSKKRKNKNVEVYGRAIFQKGGIRHTSEKVGIVIYVSLFEKKVYIIADRGAETSIPGEEWKKINESFQNIFKAPDFNKALIENLKSCKLIFSKYIPSTEDDINELPDDLDIYI